MKELLFKVTAADCRWDYFVGQGNGGQNKQKTNSAVRCTHVASGAAGVSQDHRSQDQNKKKAFERMAKTDVFQKWIKAESMRRSGEMAIIDAKVDQELLTNTSVEIQVDGKWTPAPEMKPTRQDIENAKEE